MFGDSSSIVHPHCNTCHDPSNPQNKLKRLEVSRIEPTPDLELDVRSGLVYRLNIDVVALKMGRHWLTVFRPPRRITIRIPLQIQGLRSRPAKQPTNLQQYRRHM